ncbi:MAG: sulfotransferase family protein [Marivirga sp.]|nr:sulfotransferase family protein [Marivirga sp.]
MIRINLISGPRNISTALMYSFAQRPDTVVLDEPYYAFYLDKSGIHHPGKEEVLKSQPLDEAEVSEAVFGKWGEPVLFIKNMAHHIELMDQGFLEKVTNIFLIRNPTQIIASYAQVIETPTLRDIGLEYQYNLFMNLREKGFHSIVMDSGLILQNPESVLTQACNYIGIPFMSSMLKWEAGPKPYDGVWAKYWYTNVHKSKGFEKQPTSNRPLPVHLQALNEKAQYYYQALLPFSLQP